MDANGPPSPVVESIEHAKDVAPDADVMEVDASSNIPEPPAVIEVRALRCESFDTHLIQQSPWVSEIQTLFDDCRQIATGNVFDVIG